MASIHRVPHLLRLRRLADLAALALASLACLALSSDTRADEPYLLCGDDFYFSFLPPSAWSDEWDPEDDRTLITLIPEMGLPGSGNTRIEIGLTDYGPKVHPRQASERFVENLNRMMNTLANYSTNPPDDESLLRLVLRTRPFSVSHPRYPASALLATNRRGTHLYVSFVDPRGYAGYLISVVLLADKSPATADQIATFRSVVRSLDYDPRHSCDGPLDIDPRILR